MGTPETSVTATASASLLSADLGWRNAFRTSSAIDTGRPRDCKKCSAVASRSWREANPEKWTAMTKQSRKQLEFEMNAEWTDDTDDNVEDD